MGEILEQLYISDADGDTVSVTIVDENDAFDVDGDQLGAFGLNSSNQLVVLDVSDANFLLNDNDSLTITFLLNDNNGKTSLLEGVITGAGSFENISNNNAIQRFNSNDFSLLDAVYNRDTSWYNSSWFGDFYPGKDGWLYHNNLGWLYLHPSEHNGFGFGILVIKAGGGLLRHKCIPLFFVHEPDIKYLVEQI